MLGIIVQIILLQEGSILIQGKNVYYKHINTRVHEYMQSLTKIVVILIVLQLIQVDSNPLPHFFLTFLRYQER